LDLLVASPRGGDALMLLTCLRSRHFGRPNFIASSKAMAHADLIAGWARGRYRSALSLLTELGVLVVERPGGRGPNDPRLFRFADA
jgi:hypothetical protein